MFVFFLLRVAKELYFKVRNTCQHPSTATRADDANMTRSEVRLQMRPLQNLFWKTGGLKKEMKCAEEKKKTTTTPHPTNCFIICLKVRIKDPLSGTRSSPRFWQGSGTYPACVHPHARLSLSAVTSGVNQRPPKPQSTSHVSQSQALQPGLCSKESRGCVGLRRHFGFSNTYTGASQPGSRVGLTGWPRADRQV